MFRFLQNHLQALLRYRSLLSNVSNALWDLIIVLGQHVSILIESSSGPSKIQILKSICFLEGVE